MSTFVFSKRSCAWDLYTHVIPGCLNCKMFCTWQLSPIPPAAGCRVQGFFARFGVLRAFNQRSLSNGSIGADASCELCASLSNRLLASASFS